MSTLTDSPAGLTFAETELAAWQGFLRAHAALVKTLDSELEAAHGLALSSYEVLAALDCAPERRMRMCDLAERALLSRSGLTRLVDRLERGGLIARACCDDDARGSFAVLTSTGARALGAARTTYLAAVRRRFLDQFDEADRARLGSGWARVLAANADARSSRGCCG